MKRFFVSEVRQERGGSLGDASLSRPFRHYWRIMRRMGLLLICCICPWFVPQMASHLPVVPDGQVVFLSSNESSMVPGQGFMDLVLIEVMHLPPPGMGNTYVAWLLPAATAQQGYPLRLGTLTLVQGEARMLYQDPNHANLLGSYARFEIVETPDVGQLLAMPPFDPSWWRYGGALPSSPVPVSRRSYLDHLRSLLTGDPTLADHGLSGGLVWWCSSAFLHLVQWTGDAYDESFAQYPQSEPKAAINQHFSTPAPPAGGGTPVPQSSSGVAGQQSGRMQSLLLRILSVLDGASFASKEVPVGSLLGADAEGGTFGLLMMGSSQFSYLQQIALHVEGMMQAPGHTQEEVRLARQVEMAVHLETLELQQIHQMALSLVLRNEASLHTPGAQRLLAEMDAMVIGVYGGQYKSEREGTINGVLWMRSVLQQLSAMPMTSVTVP